MNINLLINKGVQYSVRGKSLFPKVKKNVTNSVYVNGFVNKECRNENLV